MHSADVAAWASAIGTVGALGFTAYTVRRQVDRERRADDYQRRMYAKRVSVTVQDRLESAEVINDNPDSIYDVGVYIRERSSDSIIAHSSIQNIILPGEKQRFILRRTDARDSIQPPFRFVQFTDANGYRWNRYSMGRLEGVDQMANPDGDQGRIYARLVRINLIEGSFKSLDIANDAPQTIHGVRAYIIDQSSGEIIAQSAMAEAMAPGERRRFSLAVEENSVIPGDVYIIAEFVDASSRRWDRYMLGRIDEIGPMPTRTYRRGRWRVRRQGGAPTGSNRTRPATD